MKKTLIILALAISFGSGFAFNSILNKRAQIKMKRVTGIGGVFFKCKDPAKFKEWYKTHLGIDAGAYGASFEWREASDSTKNGITQWTPFPENSKYFEPSSKDFMINYRVENLEALVEELKKEGVTVLDKIEPTGYGKFVHILDAEGSKVELWEPKK
ncbi:MAG TPA: VOC family protein [Mucilaginibacter sp.]|jgi:predicted enzyme related to lactoylglutathione lyase|nr:VOC family protein [Mucilaginibacter sp.]